MEIIDMLIKELNKDDNWLESAKWFTTKNDPTFMEPRDYYELDEFGELTDKSKEQIEKEIQDIVGDGAVDIENAVKVWVDRAMANCTIDYKDNLVTTFKEKEIVKDIDAHIVDIKPVEKRLGEKKTFNKGVISNRVIKESRQLFEDTVNDNDNNDTEDNREEGTTNEETNNNQKRRKTDKDNEEKKTKADEAWYDIVNQIGAMTLDECTNFIMDMFNTTSSDKLANNFMKFVCNGSTDVNSTAEQILGLAIQLGGVDNIYDMLRERQEKKEKDKVSQQESNKKVEENVKQKVEEENTKSANLISQKFTDSNFDSNSKEGQIVMRTSELFNVLSDLGYDVQVAFDNGESTNTILLGQQGGQAIITITDENTPLTVYASGNYEVNDEIERALSEIKEQITQI